MFMRFGNNMEHFIFEIITHWGSRKSVVNVKAKNYQLALKIAYQNFPKKWFYADEFFNAGFEDDLKRSVQIFARPYIDINTGKYLKRGTY
jgi:hypothetical protein